MEYMVETKGVTRSFPVAGGDQIQVLKGINIQVPKGEFVILRGRSGSGKTTLMNILGALDDPTSGEVYLDGEEIGGLSEKKKGTIRRTKVGFVFQSVALVPTMDAMENVEFSLRLARYKGDRRKRAEECLRMVGLGGRLHHMPQQMSGGEQQRVAIARALAHKPQIIFADEPTAELDSATGVKVVKIFRDLTREEGITVMMTTHDTGLMSAGDRVFSMEDGEIVDE